MTTRCVAVCSCGKNQGVRFLISIAVSESPTIGLRETNSAVACIYREVSRRSSSMLEAVKKDWLEVQLAANLREWGLPSSTISPLERMRSLPKVENVEGRCEMTISVDVLKLR